MKAFVVGEIQYHFIKPNKGDFIHIDGILLEVKDSESKGKDSCKNCHYENDQSCPMVACWNTTNNIHEEFVFVQVPLEIN